MEALKLLSRSEMKYILAGNSECATISPCSCEVLVGCYMTECLTLPYNEITACSQEAESLGETWCPVVKAGCLQLK